jgi:signal transduction histidine kinase
VSELLQDVVALAHPAARRAAARAVARRLGGEDMVIFVRDPQVSALLPAPGFAQTLRGGREWRRFVDACVVRGECALEALMPPDGGAAEPAFGFACGEDVVAVVLGATGATAETAEFRCLLPLLASTYASERAAANAEAQARLARQAAAHAESLAAALDQVRGQLQRALRDAGSARQQLEVMNDQLQGQAIELEAQTEELLQQTDRLQQMNAALETARLVAEDANRSKSDFLATMSHELRTPLNAIGGYTQLIQLGIHGAVTDGQHAALLRIERSQRHLLRVINDILNFAKLEAGHLEYDLTPLSIAEVVADLQPMIEPQIQAKQQQYTVRVASPSLLVHADREKLQQVLLNLLSNAVKFTGEGGAISVEYEVPVTDAATVVVRVRDTGIGIPPDKRESIFEPFVQVDASHSRGGQGTGLGLAISRDLARGMGGDLRVESDGRAGSTFHLTLRRPSTP